MKYKRRGHDRSADYRTLRYWTDMAQTLERGLFDGLFIADVLGIYDVFRGGPDAALRHASARIAVLMGGREVRPATSCSRDLGRPVQRHEVARLRVICSVPEASKFMVGKGRTLAVS